MPQMETIVAKTFAHSPVHRRVSPAAPMPAVDRIVHHARTAILCMEIKMQEPAPRDVVCYARLLASRPGTFYLYYTHPL